SPTRLLRKKTGPRLVSFTAVPSSSSNGNRATSRTPDTSTSSKRCAICDRGRRTSPPNTGSLPKVSPDLISCRRERTEVPQVRSARKLTYRENEVNRSSDPFRTCRSPCRLRAGHEHRRKALFAHESIDI